MNYLEKETQIIKYYQEGYSLKKVAVLMGLSPNSNTQIKRVLVRNNIKRRPCVNPIIEKSTCPKCGGPVILKYMKGHRKEKYCSRSHANSRNLSKETRLKISKGVKAYIKKYGQPILVIKALSNNKRFTSKGEVEIRTYFQKQFPNDKWTFGGLLKIKGEGISRDLYSNKLKICIEYDGIWHFKDIHGQLAKKQLKDKLLEEWCKENNYRLIRIEDRLFKKDKEYWLNKVEEAIYKGTEQIVKFYPDKYLQKAI